MRDDSYQIIDNPEGYKRKVVPNLSTLCTQCAVSKAPDKIMERSVSDATRAGARWLHHHYTIIHLLISSINSSQGLA